jgi:GT2 family glycosyltransferase
MRPSISVVMPFAGTAAQAAAALQALSAINTRADDQLILADNSGTAPISSVVSVVRANGEKSPSHARNAGAAAARGEWILFLDADTRAAPDILDRYFDQVPGESAGALAGELVGPANPVTLAARYGAAKNFLSQAAHLAHRYRPRASTANLLVRAAAFEQAQGFTEGIRAAEDTDFCWRLQDLGWTLELRSSATAEHDYRESLKALRTQWRAYAAGRAWLAARYPDFTPELALTRQARSALRRRRLTGSAPARAVRKVSKYERAQFAAIDVLLGFEELIGFHQSNEL